MDAPKAVSGPEHQQGIYLAGLNGKKPALPISYEELEGRARAALSPQAYDYVAGGAGSERTMRSNLEAFDRWRIVPRMLRDVSQRDLSVELFGRRIPAPVLLGPVGVQGIVHKDAEIASARAAASLGLPFVLSTAASRSIEQVAQAGGDAPRWFQLYWGKDNEMAASMVQRAERSGYEALVLTLDTHVLGWRERDLSHPYLPFLLGEGVANYFTDPVFRARLAKPPEEDPRAAILHWGRVFSNSSLTWKDVAFLREQTRLPLVLKGIQHAEDARRALDAGADGIVVSNHGGRQVDGAIGALEALPGIVEAVRDEIPVLFDSGIRRGCDAFKALSLGARAVLLGRLYMWGLAIAGEAGVREVLTNFLADLDLTFALSGYASVAEADASALQPAPAPRLRAAIP